MLEAVGYWFNDRAPSAYPRPQRLVGVWDMVERSRVVAYLRAGDELESYRGTSYCRFECGMPSDQMGSLDLTDGRFAWPEGLVHYVEAHDVRLPDHFIAHALAGAPRTPPSVRRIDDAPWFAWGKARGAGIDLDGWDALTWADQKKVLAEVMDAVTEGHVLHGREVEIILGRRATKDLLCSLEDGQIAIVRLPGASTTLLASWDEWDSLPRM
jgi:hypothetical protein